MGREYSNSAGTAAFRAALACFFLSGMSALLFQTLWTREFALVFGTSDLAISMVLAAYMSGLAVGAALARRFLLALRRPLLVYALLELGIGASALAVPVAIQASRSLCVLLFGGQPEPPDGDALGGTLFTLATSFLILLLPTAFMGATLPLLTRFAVQHPEDIGRRFSLLYATNTAGAVAGTLLTAFWLLPMLGLRDTRWVGFGINALVFAIAARIARPQTPSTPAPAPIPVEAAQARFHPVLPMIFASGVCSFAYEVLWTRLLGPFVGGTLYAFGSMLAAFLGGIALGSSMASRFASSRERAERLFARVQLAIAVCAWITFVAIDRLPGWLRSEAPASGLDRVSAVVGLLFFSAFFIGASFPLAVRVVARSEHDAAAASARVYAWNTLGALCGALGAGFLWIPWLDFHGTLIAACVSNLALAVVASLGLSPRDLRTGCAALAVGLLLLFFPPGPAWRMLQVNPLDRWDPARGAEKPLEPVVFYAAGRSSTVMIRSGTEGLLSIYTNGLPESYFRPPGLPLSPNSVTWLSGLPQLARPDSRSLLVVGLGSGALLEAVTQRIDRIDVIELEAEVVEANRRMASRRARDPLQDPRLRLHVNDARGALALTDARWDLIVSQPSHPWTPGASHLFTREFFASVREHLEPGGVFVQWLSPQFLDAELLRSLLASMHGVFARSELYFFPRDSNFLFIGSDRAIEMERGVRRWIAEDPAAFAHLGVWAVEDVMAYRLLDARGFARLAQGAQPITDEVNLMQIRAPHVLDAPLHYDTLERLIAPVDSLRSPSPGLDAARMARILLSELQVGRIQRLAEALPDSAARETVRGWLAWQARDERAAVMALRRALALEPASREAWYALVRRSVRPEAEFSASAAGADAYPALGSVARAASRARRGDWAGVRALEPELAAVAGGDPLGMDAVRLRVRWRLEVGGDAEFQQALDLSEGMLPIGRGAYDSLLLARSLYATGQREISLHLVELTLKSIDRVQHEEEVPLELIEALLADFAEAGEDSEASRRILNAVSSKRLEWSRMRAGDPRSAPLR